VDITTIVGVYRMVKQLKKKVKKCEGIGNPTTRVGIEGDLFI
jgi:hypothetical protein